MTPAGSESSTKATTGGTELGPAFVIVKVYVRSCPMTAGRGAAVIETPRSATRFAVVVGVGDLRVGVGVLVCPRPDPLRAIAPSAKRTGTCPRLAIFVLSVGERNHTPAEQDGDRILES